MRSSTGTGSGVSFSVRIRESAAKELRRVVKPEDRTRIVAAVDRLAEAPYLGTALKGGLKGLRRIRVANYRMLCEIRRDELAVLVVRVVHRREAHRREAGAFRILKVHP